MGQNVTLSDQDLNNLACDYQGVFHLSYLDFCKANLIDQPKDDMIDKWVCETIACYQRTNVDKTKNVPLEALVAFFKIPPEKNSIVAKGHYKITARGVKLNTEKRVLDIMLNCHVQPTSALD